MPTEDFHRKLTAILSADVQGYSRLMEEDEDSTIRTLTAYRALMTSLIQKHRGHVVDTPGDNLLAEFGSIMDAVRCAVEIQEELRIRNADLPENRKMQFRIGINLGDIVEEGDHIYGDGVNIAARVEGLAEGGGICISGTVYDAIRNKLSMSYEFMGEHVVKNIKELVRIYRIRVEPEAETAVVQEKKAKLRKWKWVALGAAGAIILIIGVLAIWNFYLRRLPIEPAATEPEQAPVVVEIEEAPKTIAVLPFDDLSPEKDQGYFVDGLSEEILNSLTQIPGLTVIAKTSSFSFKGKDKTIQEIASVLGVDHVLEGSVRKAGNALRITAQLVKAVDSSHLWSKTYDKEFNVEEMFSVQEDIANSVADKLELTLEAFNLVGGTDKVEAYEHYLVAKGEMFTSDLAVLHSALEKIDAAIKLDPNFALAWVAKSTIHNNIAVFSSANLAITEQDESLSAAQKAIELELNLAEAHAALGFQRTWRCDLIEAESSYRKVLELTTNLSSSENSILDHYTAVGYFKKADEISQEILRNDPLDLATRNYYMTILALLGDIHGAEEEYEHSKALLGQSSDFDHIITSIRLSSGAPVSYDQLISSESTIDVVKKYLNSPKEGLAELRRIYADDKNLSHAALVTMTHCAAYFGDPNFALDSLEKAQKTASAIGHLWWPSMHEVRQLPRFKEFVKEIGLVDYWNQFGWPDICHQLDNGDFECD